MPKIDVPFSPAFLFKYNRWQDMQAKTSAGTFGYKETFTLSPADIDLITSQAQSIKDKNRTAFQINGQECFIGTPGASDLTVEESTMLLAFACYTGHPNKQATQGGIFQADYLAESRWLGSFDIPLFFQGDKALSKKDNTMTVKTGGISSKKQADELEIATSDDSNPITANYQYHITKQGNSYKIAIDQSHYSFKIDQTIWHEKILPQALTILLHTPLTEEDLFKLTPCLIHPELSQLFAKKIALASREQQALAKELITLCYDSHPRENQRLQKEIKKATDHVAKTVQTLKTTCEEYLAEVNKNRPKNAILSIVISQLNDCLNTKEDDGTKLTQFTQALYDRKDTLNKASPDAAAFFAKVAKILATVLLSIPTLGTVALGLAVYSKKKYNNPTAIWKTGKERFQDSAEKATSITKRKNTNDIGPPTKRTKR